jgi:hypothetical protein
VILANKFRVSRGQSRCGIDKTARVELGEGRWNARRGINNLSVPGFIAATVGRAAFDAPLTREAPVTRQLPAAAFEAAEADTLSFAGGRLARAISGPRLSVTVRVRGLTSVRGSHSRLQQSRARCCADGRLWVRVSFGVTKEKEILRGRAISK